MNDITPNDNTFPPDGLTPEGVGEIRTSPLPISNKKAESEKKVRLQITLTPEKTEWLSVYADKHFKGNRSAALEKFVDREACPKALKLAREIEAIRKFKHENTVRRMLGKPELEGLWTDFL